MADSKKQIRVEQIRSVQAKLQRVVIGTRDCSHIVDDTSKEKIEACIDLINSSSTNLEQTVENLNEYLNNVATAFENADKALASQIKGVTTKTMKTVRADAAKAKKKAKAAKDKKVKASTSYSKLPDSKKSKK
ncbi:hypothetical protein [Streptococcus oricebi]|uniref:Uncharacterized protein n=1 Tax=Streptococcus oricebi TaxID=1547447 RepID=A0ABS5B6D8_9STRE|nr:hypothetical protein [Streptococcus oricebi]MBP2624335.1 hypothetical protein [Streptococcus oricebi]